MLKELIQSRKIDNGAQGNFEPERLDMSIPQDEERLQQIIESNPQLVLVDDIESQLEELLRLREPGKRLSKEELDIAMRQELGNRELWQYGLWFYYSWSGRLVHLLHEKEFVAVRTNRNIYKITPEERDLLSTKIIGVVGLSVGQSISVTLAMERVCGEIRLADFDLLELTNLNRIRTGVHNLGLAKTISVAREIKEIDPYLKVKVYSEGLNEDNMDEFFGFEDRLDIIVDECDGLDVKIHLRHKAKKLGIPVVMDMSDRGTLDVERFDLEPDRSILHGFIDHLDTSIIGNLTNKEKIPYLLPMIGAETISGRLKASMLEVGESISTWPQLASAVALGGALGTDVCRRILLDQYHESGRYFVDIESQICDKEKRAGQSDFMPMPCPEPLTEDKIKKEAANLPSYSAQLDVSEFQLNEWLSAAIQAPSAGNCQPWKWYVSKDKIALFHDVHYSCSFGDFKHHASYLALGAALENFSLRALQDGVLVKFNIAPSEKINLVATVDRLESGSNDDNALELARQIESRHTNRQLADRKPLPEGSVDSLKEAWPVEQGLELDVVEDFSLMDQVGALMGDAERLRFLHPQGHYDFFNKEIRWSSEEAKASGDGLDVGSLGVDEAEIAALTVTKAPEVPILLSKWKGGQGLSKFSKNAMNAASALGIISVESSDPASLIMAGRAMERIWIKANALGLAFHPILALPLIGRRAQEGKGQGMPAWMRSEMLSILANYNELLNRSNKNDVFLFKLGVGDIEAKRSYRRRLNDLIVRN